MNWEKVEKLYREATQLRREGCLNGARSLYACAAVMGHGAALADYKGLVGSHLTAQARLKAISPERASSPGNYIFECLTYARRNERYDLESAARFYYKAAAAGSSAATNRLEALMKRPGRSPEIVMDAIGQILLEDGVLAEVCEDYSTARKRYREAFSKGNVLAWERLLRMGQEHPGVYDLARAERIYDSAVKAWICHLYFDAVVEFWRALLLGSHRAWERLVPLFGAEACGPDPNKDEAASKRCAWLGVEWALRDKSIPLFGMEYNKAVSAERDHEVTKAVHLYRNAAEHGCHTAWTRLKALLGPLRCGPEPDVLVGGAKPEESRMASHPDDSAERTTEADPILDAARHNEQLGLTDEAARLYSLAAKGGSREAWERLKALVGEHACGPEPGSAKWREDALPSRKRMSPAQLLEHALSGDAKSACHLGLKYVKAYESQYGADPVKWSHRGIPLALRKAKKWLLESLWNGHSPAAKVYDRLCLGCPALRDIDVGELETDVSDLEGNGGGARVPGESLPESAPGTETTAVTADTGGEPRAARRRDPVLTSEQLRERAEAGDAKAAFQLGKRHWNRPRSEESVREALKWLYFAFEHGYEGAASQIDYIERACKIAPPSSVPGCRHAEGGDSSPGAGGAALDHVCDGVAGSRLEREAELDGSEEDGVADYEAGENASHGMAPPPVKIKPPQHPSARFKIWVTDDFPREVRKAFGTRQGFVWDKMDEYVGDLESFEAELNTGRTKQMFSVRVGQDTLPVKKYQLSDGSRAFYIQLDTGLCASAHVGETNDGISPAPGDYCLIGVTSKSMHEEQNPYGRIVGRRFLQKRRLSLYRPVSEEIAEEEDQNDRTRRLNQAVALYAQNLPFDSYGEYCDSLSDTGVKLSEEQFGILERLVADSDRRLTLLMGCAGSGKTLMAVTLLLCRDYGGLDGRAYFALSDKLATSSETSFCRIAACKAFEDAPDSERKRFARLRDRVLSERRFSFSDLERAARDLDISPEMFAHTLGAVRPGFHNANAYLLRMLGVDSSRLVTYNAFRTWFDGNVSAQASRGLGPDDVWTEIRGLIKGYLGAHADDPGHSWYWGRSSFRRMEEAFMSGRRPGRNVVADLQDALKRCGAVLPPSGRNPDFVWSDFSASAEAAACAACPQHEEWVRLMFENVRRADFNKRGMSLSEYLELGDLQSVYPREQRQQIYEIYSSYDKWLLDNGFLDENDLARTLLGRIQSGTLPRTAPGVLVVDECQDFSEMQLIALYRLGGEKTRVVFAGDRHQIINPTYFDPERIKTMPGIGGFDPHFIRDNHRSSREIVRISNVVSGKRRERIGNLGQNYEQPEVSDTRGYFPHFLCFGDDLGTFGDGLKKIVEDPQAALIVQDEGDKKDLLSFLPEPLRRQADLMTYTIKECKGLEFKKVFCYNVLGRFHAEWERILAGRDTKHNKKYRYYFNTLYVAITRSQNGICLVEGTRATSLHGAWLVSEGRFRRNTPATFGRIIREFELKVGSAREWLKRAEIDLENAMGGEDIAAYERAMGGFDGAMERADADDVVRSDAQRGRRVCEVQIAKLQRHFSEAARMCVNYQMADLLPSVEEVGESDRRDVRLMQTVLNDGIGHVEAEDVPRVVEIFSETPEAREFLDLGVSMEMERIAALIGKATASLRENGV